jgi:hypothetical protein
MLAVLREGERVCVNVCGWWSGRDLMDVEGGLITCTTDCFCPIAALCCDVPIASFDGWEFGIQVLFRHDVANDLGQRTGLVQINV